MLNSDEGTSVWEKKSLSPDGRIASARLIGGEKDRASILKGLSKDEVEVIKAVKILSDQAGLNIGIRRQTISTCGITPGIAKLADEKISPRLAVSLHSADASLRKKIMPIANKYSLAELMQQLRKYKEKTSRRVTLEYCMIKGLNDSPAAAAELIKLLTGLQVHVNLIEYNPHPGCDFKASEQETIKEFRDILMKAGIETIIRFRRGRSIKAACGQLGAERIKNDKNL